jgi:AhpD family alkylhydroperoxidase
MSLVIQFVKLIKTRPLHSTTTTSALVVDSVEDPKTIIERIVKQGDAFMQTIQPIQLENASDATKRLFATATADNGLPSNMIKSMAQSLTVLEGYLQFSRALKGGKLDQEEREQIALAVAQTNLCEYSLAYHTARARKLGLTNENILSSREGRAADTKLDAALRFARDLVAENGDCSPAELQQAGFTDREIVEIVAHVALNIFENYFNMVARTDMDLPKVALKLKVA